MKNILDALQKSVDLVNYLDEAYFDETLANDGKLRNLLFEYNEAIGNAADEVRSLTPDKPKFRLT